MRTGPTVSGPDDWAEITEVYVRPRDRRQGVGRALVGAALGYAQSQGCTEVHLLVDADNLAALAFYGAMGFCRDSWDLRRKLL